MGTIVPSPYDYGDSGDSHGPDGLSQLRGTMSDRSSIVILHVSDMQFGAHHRFGVEGATAEDRRHASLAGRILEDLAWFRDRHRLSPDIAVASGDLAEWAMPAEFEQVHDFLGELCEGLGLSRQRVAMVPGNHDVSWKKCQAYFFNCDGDGTKPVSPYWPKWGPYSGMFSRFYDGVRGVSFAPDQPWTLFEIPEPEGKVLGGRLLDERMKPRDDLLARLRRVCEIRYPGATIDEVENASGARWMRVTRPGPQVSMFPVGVCQGSPTSEDVQAFLDDVDASYRSGDPHLTSYYVYDGEPVPAELTR